MISDDTPRVQYATNGVTTSFAVPFRFLTNLELSVWYRATASTSPTQLSFSLGDFTTTGEDNPAGGSVVFAVAPAAGVLTIYRDTGRTQPVNLLNNAQIDQEALERELDRLTVMVQELKQKIDRAITIPLTDEGTAPMVLPDSAANRKGKILGFNATTGLPETTTAAGGGGGGGGGGSPPTGTGFVHVTAGAQDPAAVAETGTGSVVLSTSPALTTPSLGAATATSINGTAIPSTATLVKTTDTLAALAATTSLQLAGVISDETGSGSLVFATSPSLVTPSLGAATATSINGTAIPSTATLVKTTDTLAALAATTSLQLAGVISDETGSGALVFATSPSLTTPSLGAATATSINGTAIPSTATLVKTTDTLAALAATTSLQLAGVISDETGSGALVFATSPSLTTPSLGAATATSINGTTIPSSVTLVKTTDTLAVHAATTSAQLAGVLSDETGSGVAVFNNAPTLLTPKIGDGSAGTKALTFNNAFVGTLQWTPTAARTLTLPDVTGTILTDQDTIGVGKGGTGLTGTPANGQLPIGNGTGYTLSTLTAGANVTITNASGSITIAATGGGGGGSPPTGTGFYHVTGGVMDPAAVAVNLGTADVTGTLTIGKGGTGLTFTPSNGQLPIGNGTGYTLSTLTAGGNVSVTNAAGSITINALPSGSANQVQYNSGAPAFAGAVKTLIDGDGNTIHDEYTTLYPSNPASGITIISRKKGGRRLIEYADPLTTGTETIPLSPHFALRNIKWVKPRGNSTTQDSNGIAVTAIGTATAAAFATTTFRQTCSRIMYASAATAGSSGGHVWNSAQFSRGAGNAGWGGFNYIARFAFPVQQTTWRFAVGLFSTSAALTNINPSTNTHFVGVVMDSSDTDVYFSHANSGASTKSASGYGNTFGTGDVFEARIFMPPGGGTVYMGFGRITPASSTWAEYSSSLTLPNASNFLSPQIWMNNGTTAAAINVEIMSSVCESWI